MSCSFFVKITLLGLRRAGVENKSVFLQYNLKENRVMKILAVGMNYAKHNEGWETFLYPGFYETV